MGLGSIVGVAPAVESEFVERGAGRAEGGDVGNLFRRFLLVGLDAAVVDLACRQRLIHGVVVGVDDEQKLVDARPSVPVLIVGRVLDVLVLRVADELEWAGADRLRILERSQLVLGGKLAENVLRYDIGKRADDIGFRDLGDQFHLVLVKLVHFDKSLDVCVPAQLVVDDGLVSVHHVIRVEGLPVMPLDALTQIERPSQAIVGNRPICGQHGEPFVVEIYAH